MRHYRVVGAVLLPHCAGLRCARCGVACKARPRRRGSDGRWTKLTGSCCARKQTNSCRTRGLAVQWARDILSLAKGVAKPVVPLQNRLVCRDLNGCDRRVELPRIRCFAREKADRAAALSACLAQPQQRLVRPADWTLQVRRRSRRGLCVRVGGVKLLRPVLVARELSEALLPPLRRRGCGHTALNVALHVIRCNQHSTPHHSRIYSRLTMPISKSQLR